MAEKIEVDLYAPSSETGELYIILKPEPSAEWKGKFLHAWDHERQRREGGSEPLGEARIVTHQLIIKEQGLDSEAWQKRVVEKALAHVNQKMAASE